MKDQWKAGSASRRFLRCLGAGLLFFALSTLVHPQEFPPATLTSGFSLTDMRGRSKKFSFPNNRVTVVIFFSTRCPMSNAFNARRNDLFHTFGKRTRFIVIDSEANESLEEERAYAKQAGFDFPVFRDSDNVVADRLGARVTTDTFVVDTTGAIRYQGYIEDAPNPARTTRQGLRLAIAAVLAGQPVPVDRTRSVGCAIRRVHPAAFQ